MINVFNLFTKKSQRQIHLSLSFVQPLKHYFEYYRQPGIPFQVIGMAYNDIHN